MSRLTRLFAATTLALMLGGLAALAMPTGAAAGIADPTPIAPEGGAVLASGTVVLEWTDVAAPEGYQVAWSSADQPGEAELATTTASTLTVELSGGSYEWAVRALPDGDWSGPANFHVDLELPTLGLPADGSAAPVVDGRGRGDIPGGVWIAGALGFSAVLLGAVVIQSRRNREQQA